MWMICPCRRAFAGWWWWWFGPHWDDQRYLWAKSGTTPRLGYGSTRSAQGKRQRRRNLRPGRRRSRHENQGARTGTEKRCIAFCGAPARRKVLLGRWGPPVKVHETATSGNTHEKQSQVSRCRDSISSKNISQQGCCSACLSTRQPPPLLQPLPADRQDDDDSAKDENAVTRWSPL